MELLALLCGLMCVVGTTLSQDAAAPTPDPACFDPELTIYIDCTEEQYAEEGKTDCCEIGDTVGCCEKGAGMKKMRDMLIGIGVGTFLLACIVFLCMYCNKKTFPCLAVCEAKAQKKYQEVEEKICCCKSNPEREQPRTREPTRPGEKVADEPGTYPREYDTTDDQNGEVKDDFWGVV